VITEDQVTKFCADKGWERTGVLASEAECDQARLWAAECRDAPVARVHGHWLHEDAEELFKRQIDGLAMAHGLPDRGEDHYGLIATGEFVVMSHVNAKAGQ
jgi:hypothetical protein